MQICQSYKEHHHRHMRWMAELDDVTIELSEASRGQSDLDQSCAFIFECFSSIIQNTLQL